MAPIGIRRVLIVDDDPQAAQLLSAIMRMVCDEIVVAATLAEGFMALRSRLFSLVLLDLMLPDSNGVETLRAVPDIKNAGARRVVGVTGTDFGDTMLDLAREVGAEGLISKADPALSAKLRGLFDEA